MLTPAQQPTWLFDARAIRRVDGDEMLLGRIPRIFTPASTLTGMWPDTRVRFIRYHDQVYQFNGRNRMRAFNGVDWRYAGIQKSGTFSAVANTDSTELSGTYLYYITAANTRVQVGDQRYVESLPTAVTSAVTVNGQRIVVTLPASHPDPQVTHWIIYRNKNGYYDINVEDDEQDFFKVAEVAVGTTTYADTIVDDLLPPITVNFRTELPPAFKYAAVYDNSVFGCGFDEFSTGTATVDSSNAALVSFSISTLPDGLVGCSFRKIGDTRTYTIESQPSQNQVILNTSFAGQLSAASYVIFRDPAMLYSSEQLNAEAWGEEGELLRNQQPIGGPGSKLKLTGVYAAHGRLYIFTLDQVYVMYGKGDQRAITTEPVLDGIGCVSSDTIVKVDDTLYWLSLQGPVAYNPAMGQKAMRIGLPLGADWMDTLNADQIGLAHGGYQPLLHTIKWAVPLDGDNENGYVYVYDIATGTWWPEEQWGPTLYWQDYDPNGQPKLYSAVGRHFFIEDVGHNDGVPSGTVTGTIASYDSGTKTLTVSGASFYTTGYGLEDRWAHVYRTSSTTGAWSLVGRSQIASNTANTITLSEAVSIQANDTLYVAPVAFRWKTKMFAQSPNNQRVEALHGRFALQGEATPNSIYTQDEQDGTTLSTTDRVAVNTTHKRFPVMLRGPHFSKTFTIPATNAEIALRSLDVETDMNDKEKR